MKSSTYYFHMKVGLILEGHACDVMKKGQESVVKGHNYEFFSLNFTNLGHLECYIPPKR